MRAHAEVKVMVTPIYSKLYIFGCTSRFFYGFAFPDSSRNPPDEPIQVIFSDIVALKNQPKMGKKKCGKGFY